jgi:ABC-type transporter Mla subunit MlaD
MVMTAFVILAAVAMAFGAAMLFGMWKSAVALERHVARLTPLFEALTDKLEVLTDNSNAAVTEGRASMAEITGQAMEIMDSTKRQVTRIESVVEDATQRVHSQLEHAEMVVDDAVNRAHQAVVAVQAGVKKPVREMSAVAVGVRTAVHHFMRGDRPNPDRVAADEERVI